MNFESFKYFSGFVISEEVKTSRSLLPIRPPIVFRSLRWSLVALKSKSGKAEAMPGLKAQLQPHSLNASLAEPAYPLVAGVAAPPLHRSDKEPLSFSFLDIRHGTRNRGPRPIEVDALSENKERYEIKRLLVSKIEIENRIQLRRKVTRISI